MSRMTNSSNTTATPMPNTFTQRGAGAAPRSGPVLASGSGGRLGHRHSSVTQHRAEDSSPAVYRSCGTTDTIEAHRRGVREAILDTTAVLVAAAICDIVTAQAALGDRHRAGDVVQVLP